MIRYMKSTLLNEATVENIIVYTSGELTEHLIKLYIYNKSEYINHWRQEVWNSLRRVPKLKSTKKFPTEKFIYSQVTGYCDMLPELASSILDEYAELTPREDIDFEFLKSQIESYYKWLSTQLSSKGVITPRECYKELEQLGF